MKAKIIKTPAFEAVNRLHKGDIVRVVDEWTTADDIYVEIVKDGYTHVIKKECIEEVKE